MSQIVDTVTHNVEIRMNINLGETNLIICAKSCVTNLVSASVQDAGYCLQKPRMGRKLNRTLKELYEDTRC